MMFGALKVRSLRSYINSVFTVNKTLENNVQWM